MGPKYDFDMRCKSYNDGNEWDLSCEYKARSKRAINEFGTNSLAFISLDHDPVVIDALSKEYGVPKSTAILSFVSRAKEKDPENKLVGIGMVMMCSLLKHMYKRLKITHIYLVATTTPDKEQSLIKLYKKFGYVSVDENAPKNMIGNIKNIAKGCIQYRHGRSIPLLIQPTKDSPIQHKVFDTETYPETIQ